MKSSPTSLSQKCPLPVSVPMCLHYGIALFRVSSAILLTEFLEVMNDKVLDSPPYWRGLMAEDEESSLQTQSDWSLRHCVEAPPYSGLKAREKPRIPYWCVDISKKYGLLSETFFFTSNMKDSTKNHATAAHCLLTRSNAQIDSFVFEPVTLHVFYQWPIFHSYLSRV